jgi:hypothetical protein
MQKNATADRKSPAANNIGILASARITFRTPCQNLSNSARITFRTPCQNLSNIKSFKKEKVTCKSLATGFAALLHYPLVEIHILTNCLLADPSEMFPQPG